MLGSFLIIVVSGPAVYIMSTLTACIHDIVVGTVTIQAKHTCITSHTCTHACFCRCVDLTAIPDDFQTCAVIHDDTTL